MVTIKHLLQNKHSGSSVGYKQQKTHLCLLGTTKWWQEVITLGSLNQNLLYNRVCCQYVVCLIKSMHMGSMRVHALAPLVCKYVAHKCTLLMGQIGEEDNHY